MRSLTSRISLYRLACWSFKRSGNLVVLAPLVDAVRFRFAQIFRFSVLTWLKVDGFAYGGGPEGSNSAEAAVFCKPCDKKHCDCQTVKCRGKPESSFHT